ncbi:hypothetical protein A11Q_557 [Pseudobdellovibrio exovorus JSS]|uniref:Uncharacterized protein n=1 Tax=Pseudobdellovibrio exovorus JSS TaxID=1184267 RepID=M4V5Y6_9BACT|nr:hypothetical protein A11Q_557 [Pseudobdellovibrio exovorus JSS]
MNLIHLRLINLGLLSFLVVFLLGFAGSQLV